MITTRRAMTNCLKIIDITKAYGKKTALDHFSYTFTEGVYGLLGPNGAGKTTLMNILTQNLKSDQGTILLNDKDITERKERYLSHVGYMQQQQAVYENLTLMRFLYYMASLKGLAKKDADMEIQELLGKVDLWEERHKYMGSFSGGMKQRALIAQALLGNPDIVILDEPTAGLDPIQRAGILQMIREMSEEKIVIISTHIIADVETVAKEILMLRQGKLLKNLSIQTDRREGESLEEMYIRLFS